MNPLERFGIRTGKDNLHEAIVYGVACVYLLMEKDIAEYLRSFNLTPAKFNALMVIKHQGQDNGLSQVQIGRCLIVTASNMTRLLDRLAKEGLVDRYAQTGDRRVNLIKISKKGSEVLDKAWPGYYNKISELGNLLGRQESKLLLKLLLKWFTKLEESSKRKQARRFRGAQ